MAANNSTLWTIEELGAEVERALAHGTPGQPNGRIREVPDQRTIRYYTTLGLIDRPAQMKGRTALYALKHLLQLVAIKRLQAEGLSLAAVQARLAGATPRSLRAIARLDEGAGALAEDRPAAKAAVGPITPQTGRSAGSFWGEVPSEQMSPDPEAPGSVPPADLMSALRIGEDILLVFSPARALEREDWEALSEAARPLLRSLETRGLIQPSKDQKGENR